LVSQPAQSAPRRPSSAAAEAQAPGMALSWVAWISAVAIAGVKPPNKAVARL
jgi:hypothetical protein